MFYAKNEEVVPKYCQVVFFVVCLSKYWLKRVKYEEQRSRIQNSVYWFYNVYNADFS